VSSDSLTLRAQRGLHKHAMTGARWQRVERLYLDALEMPAAERSGFLSKMCESDESLRAEVESLLAHGNVSFFDTPALHVAAKLMAPGHGTFVGTDIGPYHVLSTLGAGGMGEVYRAKDTRLQRVVAIKVLSNWDTAMPQDLERFHQEARAASALNHPHICTIHDVGSGPPFIAMELLEGETLQQQLARGPIELSALVDGRTRGGRRPGRCSPHRHCSSRHQAGEHLPDRPRAEDPGFRSRESDVRSGAERRHPRDSPIPGDRSR
jgi:hypothetical protein